MTSPDPAITDPIYTTLFNSDFSTLRNGSPQTAPNLVSTYIKATVGLQYYVTGYYYAINTLIPTNFATVQESAITDPIYTTLFTTPLSSLRNGSPQTAPNLVNTYTKATVGLQYYYIGYQAGLQSLQSAVKCSPGAWKGYCKDQGGINRVYLKQGCSPSSNIKTLLDSQSPSPAINYIDCTGSPGICSWNGSEIASFPSVVCNNNDIMVGYCPL